MYTANLLYSNLEIYIQFYNVGSINFTIRDNIMFIDFYLYKLLDFLVLISYNIYEIIKGGNTYGRDMEKHKRIQWILSSV